MYTLDKEIIIIFFTHQLPTLPKRWFCRRQVCRNSLFCLHLELLRPPPGNLRFPSSRPRIKRLLQTLHNLETRRIVGSNDRYSIGVLSHKEKEYWAILIFTYVHYTISFNIYNIYIYFTMYIVLHLINIIRKRACFCLQSTNYWFIF